MRWLTGRIRWLFVTFAALLMFFSSITSPVVLGEVFRINLPQFETSIGYGQSFAAVPVDLGTPLVQLASIQLELSGEDYEGWWVGDGVEDFYVGPQAGRTLRNDGFDQSVVLAMGLFVLRR